MLHKLVLHLHFNFSFVFCVLWLAFPYTGEIVKRHGNKVDVHVPILSILLGAVLFSFLCLLTCTILIHIIITRRFTKKYHTHDFKKICHVRHRYINMNEIVNTYFWHDNTCKSYVICHNRRRYSKLH